MAVIVDILKSPSRQIYLTILALPGPCRTLLSKQFGLCFFLKKIIPQIGPTLELRKIHYPICISNFSTGKEIRHLKLGYSYPYWLGSMCIFTKGYGRYSLPNYFLFSPKFRYCWRDFHANRYLGLKIKCPK